MCTCVLRLGCFLLACPVLYFVPPFSFQPFLMFTSEFNERSRSNPLCDFRLGTVATSDHETPLTEQEEINNMDKIQWEKHSWKHLSLIGDETVIDLQRAKAYVLSETVLCLGRFHPHPMTSEAWKERMGWIISDQSYRDDDGISGEPTEFEGNIFPGFTTLQLCCKVTDPLSRLGETPETFTGRILFISMFNDISCDNKDNEENVWQMLKCLHICKEIWYWTMVIHWSRF